VLPAARQARYVTWRGVEHQGKHPALVDAATFEAVQRVLVAHRVSGERSYRHQHYLAGSLFCQRCSSRLLYGVHKGRRGDEYEYFYCAGRHSGRTDCTLPYLPLDQVEQAVQRQWNDESWPPELAAWLKADLLTALNRFESEREAERQRLSLRVAAIKRERYKWAEKAMDETVPADIAREKQQELAGLLLCAESALQGLSGAVRGAEDTIRALLTVVEDCGDHYGRCGPLGRRDYNHAFFAGLDLDADDEHAVAVTRARHTDPMELLQARKEDELSNDQNLWMGLGEVT